MLEAILGGTRVDNPKELFVHNLGATLTMENTIDGMLGTLIEQATGAELKQQLRDHREETQAQIRNLHGVFQALGKEPAEQPCPAIEGIQQQAAANLKLTAPELHDSVILAGCAETEHHEIAVYENLIVHAGALNHDDVVALLQENLEQEQHALDGVLKATLGLAAQHAGAGV